MGCSVLVAMSAVAGGEGVGSAPDDEGTLLLAPSTTLPPAPPPPTLLDGVTRRFLAFFSNFRFFDSMDWPAPLLVVGVLCGGSTGSVAGSKGADTKLIRLAGVVL